MSKEEKGLIPIKKENFISRIFKFIKNIFVKEKVNTVNIITESEKEVQSNSNKKDYIKSISFRENEETNKLIEEILARIEALNLSKKEIDSLTETLQTLKTRQQESRQQNDQQSKEQEDEQQGG